MLCLTLAGVASPAAAVVTPSLNGWKWARKGVLAIDVGSNVSSTWKPYLTTATAGWSRSSYIDLLAAAGRTTVSTCNPVFGTIQVCSANYGPNGWLGYGNVWLQNGRIVMGNVRLNDYYFSLPRYDTAAWRQATVCHELGHTLGLNHSDTIRTNANLGSCLDYTNDPSGKTNPNGPRADTAPGYVDFLGLSALYAKPDKTQLAQTTLGHLTVIGAGYAVVPEPGSWTLLIAGFGIVGAVARRRRTLARPAVSRC